MQITSVIGAREMSVCSGTDYALGRCLQRFGRADGNDYLQARF
jgi:hypothetical protein